VHSLNLSHSEFVGLSNRFCLTVTKIRRTKMPTPHRLILQSHLQLHKAQTSRLSNQLNPLVQSGEIYTCFCVPNFRFCRTMTCRTTPTSVSTPPHTSLPIPTAPNTQSFKFTTQPCSLGGGEEMWISLRLFSVVTPFPDRSYYM
jgi:hypothetical protein